MRRMRVFIILGLFLLAIPQVNAQLPPGSRIAFWDSVARAILLTQENGNDLLNLTAKIKGYPTEFSPSPDGRRIAVGVWKGLVEPPGNIYVVNVDGTQPINLTQQQAPVVDQHPAWSPDGRQIAFISNRRNFGDLFVMNADGSNVQNLTADAQPLIVGWSPPNWSPDSQQIVFTVAVLKRAFILFTINRDGTGLKELLVHATHPAWSPDGRLVAFASNRGGGFPDIYRLDLQTNKIKQLTKTGGQGIQNSEPSWVPDGSGLLFTSARDRGAVWYMDADGKSQKPIWRDGVFRSIYSPHILPNPPEAVSPQKKYSTTWGTIKDR